MDAATVKHLVLNQVGNRQTNAYGWSFESGLLDPPVRREDLESDGSHSTYWTVLIESGDGYHIVFDETDDSFGLATSGTVVGWYGTFVDALDGM